jgi:hypothetical protein
MAHPESTQIQAALKAEIVTLEQHQTVLRSYLAGHEYPDYEVLGTLQGFRDTLNLVSSHILALYQLSGQRTSITWQPLIDNLSNTLETLKSVKRPNPRTAIELALNMSDPNAGKVMEYLISLKQSLK